MIIDFSLIDEHAMPNFNGGEKEFNMKKFEDDHGKVLMGRLVPGASIGIHKHVGNYEVIYFLEGEGTCYYNGTEEKVAPGTVHYCPENNEHTLINTGDSDLKFFAVLPNRK